MEQTRKHNKKKLILIISIIVIVLAGLGVGGYFIAQEIIRQNSPQYTMSDSEFLVDGSPWHKLNDDGSLSDKIIWTFNADGTGTVTTNGDIDIYGMKWTLKGNTLQIKTDWLYALDDSFSFTTNRDQGSFTVVDTTEDKLTTFVPATANAE